MRAVAPGEAVMSLRSVSPSADALLALARAGEDAWPALCSDPGAILLLVRHSATLTAASPSFSLSSLQDAALLEAAFAEVRDGRGAAFVNWTSEAARPIYTAAVSYARLAARLAEATGLSHPALAWVGGLLAPLGWLAVCAVNPSSASDCLADPDHARRPGEVEKRRWGQDSAALARRLARRWDLPAWLTAVVGHLALPADVAGPFGAVPTLFRIVQLAVLLVQRDGGGLRLDVGVSLPDALAAIHLSAAAAEEMVSAAAMETASPPAYRPLSDVPLLAEVLRLAAENRRLREGPGLQRMEQELDALHAALREARAGEAQRLQAQKLAALAEFAAGAGHEINNPLAVISGQAQFLLNKLLRSQREPLGANGPHGTNGTDHAEPPPAHFALTGALFAEEAEAALRKIIEQTQRVHQILRELMQFARPPRPSPERFDLGELVREVAASLAELAAQRRVRLECQPPAEPLWLHADPAQVRTALTCLVRNAVEAAPAQGWAGVRVDASAPDRVEVLVEDNGAGPPAQQREHLFDPFYSGRAAGRGRGLGLPIAWRLASQHGGDVRFVGLADGPTRFILSLARSPVLSSETSTFPSNGNDH